MKVAEPEILRLVYYYGVGVGYVQSVLYQRGTQHHVVVAAHEVEHYVLEMARFHLTVGYAYLHVGHEAVEYLIDGIKLLDPVVQEEQLSSAVEFVVYYALYLLLVEKYDFGLHRNAVRRGSVDYAEVPRPEK